MVEGEEKRGRDRPARARKQSELGRENVVDRGSASTENKRVKEREEGAQISEWRRV